MNSSSNTSPVTVRPLEGRRDRRAWVALPQAVHADDPAWIAPLDLMESMRIKPGGNPFFQTGEAELFLARRGDEVVGRISAQIDRRIEERRGRIVGQFGFFCCREDPQAAHALVDAAAEWCRARGAVALEGPFSFSINEECGLLVEGFSTPPAMLMNHARPWFGALLEGAGLTKAIDTFAYRLPLAGADDRLNRLTALAGPVTGSGLRIRPIDVSRFEAEIRVVIDVFNDAWSDNWGFLPFSEAEIAALVRELRPFYRPGYGRIAELDGEPIAIMLAIPDLVGITADFGGRLLPFHWARLARTLWRDQARSFRIPLLGIRKRHRTNLIGARILPLLIADFLAEAARRDIDWVEFSWVLESNRAMNALAQLVAGEPIKRYRIYEMPLTADANEALPTVRE